MSIQLRGSVTLESSTSDGYAEIDCWMAHSGFVPVAEVRVYKDAKARTVLLRNPDGVRFALVQAINDEWLREAMHPDNQFGGWEIVYDLNATKEAP